MLRRVRGRLARTVTIAATLATCAAPLPAHSQKPSSPPSSPKQKVSVFSSLAAEYLKECFERFPVVATYLGAAGLDPVYAALDGKLRDYSPGALHAERDAWTGFQARLAKIDTRKLTEPERIDAAALKAQLAFLVRNLDRRVHERALDAFLEEPLRGIEFTFQGMTDRAGGARDTAAEWRGVALRTAAVPAYLKTALANVRRGASGNAIPDRRLVVAAVEAAESTAVYFEKSLPEKAEQWGAGADARSALSVGCPAAASAFRDFRRGLVELFFEAGGKALKPAFDKDRFAAGEAEYSWALKNNLAVTRSPRDLHADGKAAVAARSAGRSKGRPSRRNGFTRTSSSRVRFRRGSSGRASSRRHGHAPATRERPARPISESPDSLYT